MTPPPDNQVAALREEIRRAGRATRRSRLLILDIVALCLLVGAGLEWIWSLALAAGPYRKLLSWAEVVTVGATMRLGLGAAAGALLAFPLARGYRSWRCRQLRHRLRSLSPDQAQAVIEPLRRESWGDTLKIVEPLLAELQGISAELTPAAAPEGRGDEASPAERSHDSTP